MFLYKGNKRKFCGQVRLKRNFDKGMKKQRRIMKEGKRNRDKREKETLEINFVPTVITYFVTRWISFY